jgi:hypothetical protein
MLQIILANLNVGGIQTFLFAGGSAAQRLSTRPI